MSYRFTMPPPPSSILAQLFYFDNATEPSVALIPQRSPTGETWPPLRLTGQQWRLLQLLQRSGSRFI